MKAESEENISKTITNSRFGNIEITQDRIINFADGLFGFPLLKKYVIGKLVDKTSNFLVLQSIDEADLSFLVMPIMLDNQFIMKQDLLEILEVLHIKEQEAAFFAILSASLNPINNEYKISINCKAPLVIDTEKLTAIQFVFHNDLYNVARDLNIS